MDFDMGESGAGAAVVGAITGLGNAAKNLYQIQQAKAKLQMDQDANDADINLKHAQADHFEAQGQITSLEADQMRDYINQQKKLNDAKSDLSDTTISTVQDRIANQARTYHGILKNVINTPQGQQFLKQAQAQRGLANGGGIPSQNTADTNNPVTGQDNTSSAVVNNIMPGVGAQDAQYNASNPPPMSMANGGANVPVQQPQPQQQSIAQPSVQNQQNNQSNIETSPSNQPVQSNQNIQQSQDGQQQSVGSDGEPLPPIDKLYQGLSKQPFGQNINDNWVKNPNVVEAIKSGNYMIKKDASQIEAENPLHMNENDRTILNDVTDLKKAGYDQNSIFKQLTPGTQSLINTVGQYKATPAELTSSFGGGAQKQALVKAVQSFYPNWNDAVYDQRHKALVDFTDPNGANGKAIVSMRQGIEHMGELTQSIDAVSNKTIPGSFGRQVPILNAPMNKIMQYVGGDPDILALKQNINAVSEEMTKAWGGSQAGEGRLKAWRDTLSATNSPQGWAGLLSKTAKLWQAAADTRESMFGLAMGGQKMQDVLGEGVLQPQQQAILDKVKNGYNPGQTNNGTGNNNTNNAFIQKAKAAGYSDQDIQSFLSGKK